MTVIRHHVDQAPDLLAHPDTTPQQRATARLRIAEWAATHGDVPVAKELMDMLGLIGDDE